MKIFAFYADGSADDSQRVLSAGSAPTWYLARAQVQKIYGTRGVTVLSEEESAEFMRRTALRSRAVQFEWAFEWDEQTGTFRDMDGMVEFRCLYATTDAGWKIETGFEPARTAAKPKRTEPKRTANRRRAR